MAINRTIQELAEKSPKSPHFKGKILSLDPGHTVGFSVFHGSTYYISGQEKFSYGLLPTLIDKFSPELVIMEGYYLYASKNDTQINSTFATVRIIGIFEYQLYQRQIKYAIQRASQAKINLYRRENLEAWGVWQPGKTHAGDATRHALRFLIQGKNVEIHEPNEPTIYWYT